MTPLERSTQGLLTRRCREAAGGKQAQALVQRCGEFRQAEQRHPRGRQLDRQRDAVQLPADVDHRRHVVVGDLEAPVGCACALAEQRQRAEALHLGRRRCPRRQVERSEAIHLLVDDLQRHLAGDEQPHTRRGTQQRFRDDRDRLHQVLGVVERDQQLE